MKEFDENDAVKAMMKSLPEEPQTPALFDAVCEILDLIFDYYEDNDQLNLDNDDEVDLDDMVAYVDKYYQKSEPTMPFTKAQIDAMIIAELDYEDSLL